MSVGGRRLWPSVGGGKDISYQFLSMFLSVAGTFPNLAEVILQLLSKGDICQRCAGCQTLHVDLWSPRVFLSSKNVPFQFASFPCVHLLQTLVTSHLRDIFCPFFPELFLKRLSPKPSRNPHPLLPGKSRGSRWFGYLGGKAVLGSWGLADMPICRDLLTSTQTLAKG